MPRARTRGPQSPVSTPRKRCDPVMHFLDEDSSPEPYGESTTDDCVPFGMVTESRTPQHRPRQRNCFSEDSSKAKVRMIDAGRSSSSAVRRETASYGGVRRESSSQGDRTPPAHRRGTAQDDDRYDRCERDECSRRGERDEYGPKTDPVDRRHRKQSDRHDSGADESNSDYYDRSDDSGRSRSKRNDSSRASRKLSWAGDRGADTDRVDRGGGGRRREERRHDEQQRHDGPRSERTRRSSRREIESESEDEDGELRSDDPRGSSSSDSGLDDRAQLSGSDLGSSDEAPGSRRPDPRGGQQSPRGSRGSSESRRRSSGGAPAPRIVTPPPKNSTKAAMKNVPPTLGPFGLLPNEKFFVDTESVDNRALAYQPVPQGELMLCKLTRHRGSSSRWPTFEMKIEDGSGNAYRTVLLARRQRHGKNVSYLIGADRGSFTNDSHSGKLKSNMKGSNFVLYDDGSKKSRKEVAEVIYTHKSWSNPRGLVVRVPHGKKTMSLVNALPEWDPLLKVHSLKFNGRATEVSVKNFKLIRDSAESGCQDQQPFLLRLGKMGKDSFNLDFRYPLTPLQALGIALTSFEGGRA